MNRLHRLLILLVPLLLGGDCPGGEYRELWVRVEILPSRVSGDVHPPTQVQTVRVRFRRETASRDLALQEGIDVEGSLFSPDATVVRPQATLHFRDRDSGHEFTTKTRDAGQFQAFGVLPGTYDLTIYPDQYENRFGITSSVVVIPETDLLDLPVTWGDHEVRARIVRREIGVDDPIGIEGLVVEAFEESDAGDLRHTGQWTTTLGDTDTTAQGEFSLFLPEGTYTLRISSPADAEEPYPTVLRTGVQVPQPRPPPQGPPMALFTYPTWDDAHRHELSGKLIAPGIGIDLPEGSALVEARGVVHAPPEYAALDDVDFQLGPLRHAVRTTVEGDFRLGLPAATYSLDVIPGYDSDGSSFRDTGGQAHDLSNDIPLGTVYLTSRVYLTMRVVDTADKALEGAQVEVRNLGLSGYGRAVATDANGTARFLLEQGPHRVTVVPPEDSTLAREEFEVEMGTADQVLIVPLEDGIRVTGQISVGNDLVDGVLVRFVDPVAGNVLGEGLSRSSGTYELRVPTAWVWPETEETGDDDSAL